MKSIKSVLKPRFAAIFVASACLLGGLAACQKTDKKASLGEQELQLTSANLAGNWDIAPVQGALTTTQLRFSTTQMTTFVTDGAVGQQSVVPYELGTDSIRFPGTAKRTPYVVRSLTKSRLVMAMDEAGAFFITLTRNENSGQSVLKPVQQGLELIFKVGTDEGKTFNLAQRVNTDDTGKDAITCRLKSGLLTVEASRAESGKTFGFKFSSRKVGQALKPDGAEFKNSFTKIGDVEFSGTTDQGREFAVDIPARERCQAEFSHEGHILGVTISCANLVGPTGSPGLAVTTGGQCVLRLL